MTDKEKNNVIELPDGGTVQEPLDLSSLGILEGIRNDMYGKKKVLVTAKDGREIVFEMDNKFSDEKMETFKQLFLLSVKEIFQIYEKNLRKNKIQNPLMEIDTTKDNPEMEKLVVGAMYMDILNVFTSIDFGGYDIPLEEKNKTVRMLSEIGVWEEIVSQLDKDEVLRVAQIGSDAVDDALKKVNKKLEDDVKEYEEDTTPKKETKAMKKAKETKKSVKKKKADEDSPLEGIDLPEESKK